MAENGSNETVPTRHNRQTGDSGTAAFVTNRSFYDQLATVAPYVNVWNYSLSLTTPNQPSSADLVPLPSTSSGLTGASVVAEQFITDLFALDAPSTSSHRIVALPGTASIDDVVNAQCFLPATASRRRKLSREAKRPQPFPVCSQELQQSSAAIKVDNYRKSPKPKTRFETHTTVHLPPLDANANIVYNSLPSGFNRTVVPPIQASPLPDSSLPNLFGSSATEGIHGLRAQPLAHSSDDVVLSSDELRPEREIIRLDNPRPNILRARNEYVDPNKHLLEVLRQSRATDCVGGGEYRRSQSSSRSSGVSGSRRLQLGSAQSPVVSSCVVSGVGVSSRDASPASATARFNGTGNCGSRRHLQQASTSAHHHRKASLVEVLALSQASTASSSHTAQRPSSVRSRNSKGTFLNTGHDREHSSGDPLRQPAQIPSSGSAATGSRRSSHSVAVVTCQPRFHDNNDGLRSDVLQLAQPPSGRSATVQQDLMVQVSITSSCNASGSNRELVELPLQNMQREPCSNNNTAKQPFSGSKVSGNAQAAALDFKHVRPHICRECGKCRCVACTTPRSLPSCLICDNRCLLSADSLVDGLSCVCCVKGCVYHFDADTDDRYAYNKDAAESEHFEEPRSDSCINSCCSSGCVRRWSCWGLAALFLPCIWCYFPLKACAKLCSLCYTGCCNDGCRCSSTNNASWRTANNGAGGFDSSPPLAKVILEETTPTAQTRKHLLIAEEPLVNTDAYATSGWGKHV